MKTQPPTHSLVAEMTGDDELTLLETVDHILNKGVVIAGEITISVASIDLVYLGVNLLVGSVDAIDRVLTERIDK